MNIDEVVRSVSYVERAAIQAATETHSAEVWARTIGSAVRADLLREMVGNPFCPLADPDPAVLAWNDGTVRRIAEGIYNEQAFDRLPILADALQDAGCENDYILDHCCCEGPHVRGCWGIDLLLGKECRNILPHRLYTEAARP